MKLLLALLVTAPLLADDILFELSGSFSDGLSLQGRLTFSGSDQRFVPGQLDALLTGPNVVDFPLFRDMFQTISPTGATFYEEFEDDFRNLKIEGAVSFVDGTGAWTGSENIGTGVFAQGGGTIVDPTPGPIPEPSAWILLATCLIALRSFRPLRRRF